MKQFRFTLQRALDWQRERCDLIENRIKSLCRELESIQARLAATRAALTAAEQQVLNARQIDGASLISLTSYRLRQLKTEASFSLEREACQQRLVEQRASWIEARKRYRVLERLRHRKQVDHSYEADRELERVASDAYAARWHVDRTTRESPAPRSQSTRLLG